MARLTRTINAVLEWLEITFKLSIIPVFSEGYGGAEVAICKDISPHPVSI